MPDDFSADITTTGIISVGGTATGTIEGGVSFDRDWFAVDLAAGATYLIRLLSRHPTETALHDPYIRGIHDAAGTLLPLSTDDDSGYFLDSFLRFEVATTGRFFISAGCYDSDPVLRPVGQQGTGYTLSITEALTLNGGPGNDWLIWQPGVERADGGAGIDTLSMVNANSAIVASIGPGLTQGYVQAEGTGTAIANIENVTGSRFGDSIFGNSGVNILRGLAGNDLLEGIGGADLLDGGSGRDAVTLNDVYDLAEDDVIASLFRGRVWAGDGAGSRLLNIENLSSGGGDDMLTGNHLRNIISAGSGDDTMAGLGGDDYLQGYFGTDTVIFGFARAEYTITRNGIATTVDHTGGSGADGTDLLAHIEILRFADGDVIL